MQSSAKLKGKMDLSFYGLTMENKNNIDKSNIFFRSAPKYRGITPCAGAFFFIQGPQSLVW